MVNKGEAAPSSLWGHLEEGQHSPVVGGGFQRKTASSYWRTWSGGNGLVGGNSVDTHTLVMFGER